MDVQGQGGGEWLGPGPDGVCSQGASASASASKQMHVLLMQMQSNSLVDEELRLD
jgi:hypothetical protein